jgi:hypothetical protein
MKDPIERQDAIDAAMNDSLILNAMDSVKDGDIHRTKRAIVRLLASLPSAQPEQRYTEEELRVFKHGISLSLLSKRSSQHWQYDEDTATEIKFLERLYEKVGADVRGEQDDSV